MWHGRLAHQGDAVLNHMIRHNYASGIPELRHYTPKHSKCLSCEIGKSTMKPVGDKRYTDKQKMSGVNGGGGVVTDINEPSNLIQKGAKQPQNSCHRRRIESLIGKHVRDIFDTTKSTSSPHYPVTMLPMKGSDDGDVVWIYTEEKTTCMTWTWDSLFLLLV